MEFKQFYLGCLAHASYLVGSEGEAAIVDPQRDVEQYLEEAAARGLAIKAILETHLHADFVSGHHELAARTGARIYIGHRAGARFDHVAVHDGSELRLGSLTLRFLETPGHTPEGISILVYEAGASAPSKILTGDTLFIGDVGRPDLVGSRGYTAEQMAGLLYDSLQTKILPLPDAIEIYPAHGAGSACGRFMSSERSSTLGDQRRTNWALQPMTREAFVSRLTTGLAPPPRYFTHDAELNRRGADELAELPPPAALSAEQVAERQRGGALLLDVRDAASFGAGHVPGAVNLGLVGNFAPWAGTLLEVGTPVLLVGRTDEEVHEATVRLARIGLESVVGYLAGGLEAWIRAGLPVAKVRQMTAAELHAEMQRGTPLQLVDVRKLAEHLSGHVPGARHIPLDDLELRVGELDPKRPTYVLCGSGYRSSAACSLLLRHGFAEPINLTGGHGAWKEARLPMEQPTSSEAQAPQA